MTILTEVIVNAATTLSLGGGLLWFNKRKPKKPISSLSGIYTWKQMNEGAEFRCHKM